MFIDTDQTVRNVFTDLHARSIVACGGLKESIQDLKRDVMMTVYEVKDRKEVTDEVLADLLGISDRWLRMLGDTKPPPKPTSDGRRLLLLLQNSKKALRLDDVMDALRKAEDFSGPRRVQRLLSGLTDLGQVETTGQGKERQYKATSKTQIHIAEKKERGREAHKRLSSLLSTVYSYVQGASGALCSRYQYRIRKDRSKLLAERIRQAVSDILMEEEALCKGLAPNKTREYTVLLNAAEGLSGKPHTLIEEDHEKENG